MWCTRWNHIKQKPNSSSELTADIHQSASHWTIFFFKKRVHLIFFCDLAVLIATYWSEFSKSPLYVWSTSVTRFSFTQTYQFRLFCQGPDQQLPTSQNVFHWKRLKSRLCLSKLFRWTERVNGHKKVLFLGNWEHIFIQIPGYISSIKVSVDISKDFCNDLCLSLSGFGCSVVRHDSKKKLTFETLFESSWLTD